LYNLLWGWTNTYLIGVVEETIPFELLKLRDVHATEIYVVKGKVPVLN